MTNKLRHNGRIIGELRGKHLVKIGKQAQLYRVYDGFGLSEEVIDLLDKVTVHYNGVEYTARAEDFWTHGIPHNFHGDWQRILPRQFWQHKDKNQEKLL